MNNSSLPADDLPPPNLDLIDSLMRLNLEESLAKCFFQACTKRQQALLSTCQWYITTANVPTLVIECPDDVTNWRLLKALVKLGGVLKKLAKNAKIRVYPPGMGTAFEMRVDELFVYKYSP
jgi:hypothetical protein